MKKLLFLLLLIPFLGTSQGTFTAPVGYNTGTPTAAPSGVGTRWRFDLLTGKKYTWLPGSMAWDEDAAGIDQVSGCASPAYTPGYNQSNFAVNSCSTPELYQYYSSAWHCLNCGGGTNISAGSGITITGAAPDITISADDNSPTNEIQTLSIAGSNLSLSNGGGTVALPATGITSLGGQTGGTQTFSTGTSGTDFSISSTTNTHTFNVPSASASNRGFLTSADWSVFNGKIGGGGASGRAAYFSGVGTLTSSANYNYDGTELSITRNVNDQASLLSVRNSNAGSGTSTRFNIFNNSGSASGVNGTSFFLTNSAWSGAYQSTFGIWNYEPGSVVIATNGAEKMRVTPTGVSVGTTSNASATLQVAGTVNISGVTTLSERIVVNAGTDVATFTSATGMARVTVNATNNAGFDFYNTGGKKWTTASYKPSGTNYSYTFYNEQTATNSMFINGDNNNVAIGNNTTPSARLTVVGASGYNQFNISTTYTPTGSADALGATGDIAWDANYIYIKTAAGWKRAALSTF